MTYAFTTRRNGLSPADSFSQLMDWMGLRGTEAESPLVPAMDVSETDEGLTITMELPGLPKENLDVTLENGNLTVSGEKKVERNRESERYHAVERRTGSFRRSVTLPTDVDADKADAAFEDGVLTIRIPKSEQVKPKRLTIG